MKEDIRDLTVEELKNVVLKVDNKSYRADQVTDWIHSKLVENTDEMTNVSKNIKDYINENYFLSLPKIIVKQTSAVDDTKKYLLKLRDENTIECVLMKAKYGNTLCISTQIGCKMGCKFCASTLKGLVRNLRVSELLGQVYTVMKDNNYEPINNLVLMGIGEPLDNYDNVVKFLKMISSDIGIQISARHITVSTCGIVPNMRKLISESLPVTLALSLHATSQDKRKRLMPIANKYKLEDVLKECQYYFEKTGRRVTYEFALVSGVNDSIDEANKLANLICKYPAHLNLIPVNEVNETNLKKPDKKRIETFINHLKARNINVTLRRSLGKDIDAACGQLRAKHMERLSD